MRFKSLELNWLSRYDKDLPLPEIVYSPDNVDFHGRRCGGCYYSPERNEYLFGDVYVPFDNGVILVGAREPELMIGTLAHEWRHHWQLHRGLAKDGSGYNQEDFASLDTYNAAIRKYFRTQPHEMDALRFQFKHAPDWCSQNMLDISLRAVA